MIGYQFSTDCIDHMNLVIQCYLPWTCPGGLTFRTIVEGENLMLARSGGWGEPALGVDVWNNVRLFDLYEPDPLLHGQLSLIVRYNPLLNYQGEIWGVYSEFKVYLYPTFVIVIIYAA